MTITLLKISPASHEDIEARIRAMGPVYSAMMLKSHPEHGVVIILENSEVGMIKDAQITRQFTWPPSGM